MTPPNASQSKELSYADAYRVIASQLLRKPQEERQLPGAEAVLNQEQLIYHNSVIFNLRKKRHKQPFKNQFLASLEALGAHYTYVTERYLESVGDDLKWLTSYLPNELDYRWMILSRSPRGLSAECKNGLVVMMSGCTEQDGKRWLHVSLSRQDRIPNWDDIVYVKETFLGRDSEAIIKLAPRSQWVNLMPYCMHLWHCVDGDVTPDFTHGSGTI